MVIIKTYRNENPMFFSLLLLTNKMTFKMVILYVGNLFVILLWHESKFHQFFAFDLESEKKLLWPKCVDFLGEWLNVNSAHLQQVRSLT